MKKDDRAFNDFFDGIGKEFLDSFVVSKEIDEPTQEFVEIIDSESPMLANHTNETIISKEMGISDFANSYGDSSEKHDTAVCEEPVRCNLDSEVIDRIALKLNDNNISDGVMDSAVNNYDVKETSDSVSKSEDENSSEETETQEIVDNTEDELLSSYIHTEEHLRGNTFQSEMHVDEKMDNNTDEMLSSFDGGEVLTEDYVSDSSNEERREKAEPSRLERTTDDIIAELLGIKKVPEGNDSSETEADVAEESPEESLLDATYEADSINAKSANDELIEVVGSQKEPLVSTESPVETFVVEEHKKTANTADDIIAELLGIKKVSVGNDGSETEADVAEESPEVSLAGATYRGDSPSTKSANDELIEGVVLQKEPVKFTEPPIESFVVEEHKQADNPADDIIAKLLLGNNPVEASKKTESKTESIEITAPVNNEKNANDIIASMMSKSGASEFEDNSNDKSQKRKKEDVVSNDNSYEIETATSEYTEKKKPSIKVVIAVVIAILLVILGAVKIFNPGNDEYDDQEGYYNYDSDDEYDEDYDGENDSIIRAYLDEYDSDSVLQALYYVDEDGYVLTDEPDGYTSTTGGCPRYLQCPVYDFEDGYAYINTPTCWGWIDESALQPIESPNLYDCTEINEYGHLTDFRDGGISVHPEPRKNSETIYLIFENDIFKILYVCEADDTSFAFIKYVDSVGQVSYGWLNMAYAEVEY